MEWIVVGALFGVGFVLALAFFTEIITLLIAAPIVIVGLALLLGLGLFAANFIQSMMLQAPWTPVVLFAVGLPIFILARRGRRERLRGR